MTRFYFNVREGDALLTDTDGQEFSDLNQARDEAISLSREIMADRILHGGAIGDRTVEIADETGKVLDTVSAKNVVFGPAGIRTFPDDVTQTAPKQP
jgi:hypothetical protein